MKKYFILLLIVMAVNCVAREADFAVTKKIEFTIKENRKGEIKLTSDTEIKYTFLTKESTKINIYPITERFYAPIKNISGSYLDNHGYRIRQFNEPEITWTYENSPNVFSSDYKIHKLYFNKKKEIGDRISITYDEKYWELAYLPVIEIYSGDKVDSYILEFNHPKNYEITYETFFPRDEFMNNIIKPTEKKTIITFNNLYIDDDLDFFGYNSTYAMVLMHIFRDGEEITPFNLENYVNWFHQKVDMNPVFLNEKYHTLLKSEVELAATDKEKLKLIYEYVRNNFRYIASNENNHSFFPHEVDKIMQNGYGDCKDKAYLLKAIAAQYGLKVDLALVNSNVTPKVNYFHFSLYDHIICSFTDSTGTLFMDPTTKYCEFGNLPFTDYEKHALILNKENPRQEWIPKPNNEFDTILEVTADVDSLKRCPAKVTLYNDDYMYAKSIYKNYQGLEFENRMSNFLTSYFYKISLDYFKFENETENSIIFKAKADLQEFVISTETRKYMQRTSFVTFDKDILTRSDDNYELHVKATSKLKLIIDLQTNDFDIKTEELLLGDLDADYFFSKIEKSENGYTLDYEFNNRKMFYKADEKLEFIELARKYMKSKKNMIVLSKEEN